MADFEAAMEAPNTKTAEATRADETSSPPRSEEAGWHGPQAE